MGRMSRPALFVLRVHIARASSTGCSSWLGSRRGLPVGTGRRGISAIPITGSSQAVATASQLHVTHFYTRAASGSCPSPARGGFF
jgi:hypothetical protein